MFKGFQNNRRSNGFNSFPALNFQMNNEAYGFSGCSFWLDAAYGLNTQTDLAAVSLWTDKIKGVQFTQSTAGNQPRFVLSSVNLNNYPTIENIDGSRFMTAKLNTGFNLTSNFTLVWIGKMNVNNNASVIMGNGPNSSEPHSIIFHGGTSAGWNGFGYYQNGGFRLQGTTEGTNSRICIITNDTVMVNGVVENTGSIGSDFQSTLNVLFKYDTVSSFALRGETAEIIGWSNFKMTSSQMLTLSSNINTKYAIY